MQVQIEDGEWQKLTPEEKKIRLFEKQKGILDSFVERGAISKAQYEQSLKDLKTKMGV